MTPEEENYLKQLEDTVREQRAQSTNITQAASSVFQAQQNPNLIEWQLELDNILEKIDHLLRGHTLDYDKKGNQIWKEPKDKNLRPLNEYGVQKLMNIMTFFLNRNTILSNHSEDRIKEICFDFGNYLTDEIFMEYEKMGMDTKDKMKKYPMIVFLLTVTIENAFLRALHGGERESLRTARSVVQSDPRGMGANGMPTPPQKSFKFYNPLTWLKT